MLARRLIPFVVTLALAGPAFATTTDGQPGQPGQPDDDECIRPLELPPLPAAPPIELDCRVDVNGGVDCWPHGPSGLPRPDGPAPFASHDMLGAIPPSLPPPAADRFRGAAAETPIHPGYARRIERPPR